MILRKSFLQNDTIWLQTSGGYTRNNKYSKKALTWLQHMEDTEEVNLMHDRNGRE